MVAVVSHTTMIAPNNRGNIFPFNFKNTIVFLFIGVAF